MWNTKPPLMIWLQVASIHLFGFNEIAIRLPSALAGFFTCLSIFFFFKRYKKDARLGFVAALTLVCITSYVETHVTRTGDYDSLLVLFVTLFSLTFYLYIQELKSKYLLFFFVVLTLAVLTKGIVAYLFGPSLLLFAIYKNQLMNIIKSPQFWLLLVFHLAIVIGYYLIRDHLNPGYLQAVFKNELGGRMFEVNEGNTGGIFYYLTDLSLAIIPISIFVLIFKKKFIYRDLVAFCLTMVIPFLIIISISQTKLVWYSAPVYPILAIIIGCVVISLLEDVYRLISSNAKKHNLIVLVAFILLMTIPYTAVLKKVYSHEPMEENSSSYFSHFLKDVLEGKENSMLVDGAAVVKDGYYVHQDFYIAALNKKGYSIRYLNKESIKDGDRLIIGQSHMKNFIFDNCPNSLVIFEKDPVYVIEIKD